MAYERGRRCGWGTLCVLGGLLTGVVAVAFSAGVSGGAMFPVGRYTGDGWRFGYIDVNGKIVVPLQYDGAGECREGLASVQSGDRCGYIDTTGRLVIQPQWDSAEPFSEGLATVADTAPGGGTYQYGLIDKQGRVVLQPSRREFINPFSEGLARSGAAYLNRQGQVAIQPAGWTWGQSFSQGRAAVEQNERWGFIDKTGQIVIPITFYAVHSFSEGLAAVQETQGGPWGYIDREGRYVLPPQYESAGSFSSGLAPVQPNENEKFGYINPSGRMMIQPQFEQAFAFSEGLAEVRQASGAIGWIDTSGKVVIDTSRFEDDVYQSEPFHNGAAKVGMMKQDCWINRQGKLIWGPQE